MIRARSEVRSISRGRTFRNFESAGTPLLQGYAAGQAGLKRLVFEVTANQVAAVRAAEKCGFRRKGKSKNDPLQVVYSWDVPVP